MSLDGGCVSSGPGARGTASAMEEEYCLHGHERFHRQWATTGVFQAGALRLYGVTGEALLLRSIQQARMFGAVFGTCFLGHFPSPPAGPPSADADKIEAGSAGTMKRVPPADANGSSAESGLPFCPLLLGPVQQPEFAVNAQLELEAWRREAMRAWNVLQMPSEWCQAMNGVVTEENWSTREQRQRIKEQLELASFMCLRAVQVPLPLYAPDCPWAATVSDGDDACTDERGSAEGEEAPARTKGEVRAIALSPDEEDQRNIRLVCLAADILLAFIQQGSHAKVWVRCDACNPAHRYQMQRLREAVLYGYTCRVAPDNRRIYFINTPCRVTGTCNTSTSSSYAAGCCGPAEGTVHTEAVASLVALLYFSSWHPRMLLSSEWFGEQVVCFECPSAALLFACMAPHGIAPQQHPHYRPDTEPAGKGKVGRSWGSGDATGMLSTSAMVSSVMAGDEERLLVAEEGETRPHPNRDERTDSRHRRAPRSYDVSRRSSLAHLADLQENKDNGSAVFSNAAYSLLSWREEQPVEGKGTPHTASAGAVTPNGLGVKSSSSPSERGGAADTRRSDVLHHRYLYVMPEDLYPLSSSRWAGCYPPFVSMLTFLVEMMRRRALPLFGRDFFDQYPLLNHLYFKAVEEPMRDAFASYEDQLQLPLQPLSHHLSSSVYEVFERDARKYRQYREAVYGYVKDWYEAGPARQHAFQNRKFFEQHGVMREVPMPSTDERVLHVVLLGCGRGPLIDECLSAASALGVRLRIFAIEKNCPAAAFTRMRWANDPEWVQLAYTLGHTLEVLAVDGRHLARAAQDGSVVLPPDFGLCDVVVSELLGSVGDNELSPECLEALHEQLRDIQHSRGLNHNTYLTCIPQQYTAWVAPLMSASLEAAVAEAAVKGLTVVPPHCTDRHAALDHSLFVSNLCRGVTLAPPQACWSFTHNFGVPPASSRASMDISSVPASDFGGSGSTASPMERSAHLTFTVPPRGRCSGLAGYFSCVLYESPTWPAVTISTAPVQRTDDMYSWFPCAFALDPSQRRELHEVEAAASTKSGAVAIYVDLERKTSAERRQVWYEWSVRYSDAGEAPCDAEATAVVVHNRDGWASSMLL